MAILCLFNQSLVDTTLFRPFAFSNYFIGVSFSFHLYPSHCLCSYLPTGNFQMRPQTQRLWNWIHLFPTTWQSPEFCLWVKSYKSKTVTWFSFTLPPTPVPSSQSPCALVLPPSLLLLFTIITFLKYYKLFTAIFLASKFIASTSGGQGDLSHLKSCSELLLAFSIQFKPSSKTSSFVPQQYPTLPSAGTHHPVLQLLVC